MTLHLVPATLLLRSALIQGVPWFVLAPPLFGLILWAALVSVPYYDSLDRLLAGAATRGGLGYPHCRAHIEDPTSAFSRATYWFILPFLWRNYWSPVTLERIPAIREDDGAAASAGAFRAFQAGRDRKYEAKHGVPRVRILGIDLILHFFPEITLQVVWALLFTVLQYLPPMGLRLFLQHLQNRDTNPQPAHVAGIYIFMMVLGQGVGVMVYGQSLMIGRRVCVRMRSIIITEVFAKALRREDRSGAVKKQADGEAVDASAETLESSSDGKVANFVSVDAFTISEVCAYFFYIVSCPIAIVINLWLLHETLGPAAYAGVAVLLLLIPLQTAIGKLYTRFRSRLMAATDERLDAVTEVISFIKLIKYNSWQDKFLERMEGTRKRELRVLAQQFGLLVLSNIIIWGTPVLVTAAGFGVHVLVLHQPLTADRAFASLVLFNMLRDPLALLADTITRILQAYTSASRIQDFLNEPDTLKYAQISVPSPSDPTIGFKDALFAHPGAEGESEESGEQQQFRLGELDLSFPVGELSVVAGPVGAGKTTLILSLLGETTLLKGKVFMPDDRANRALLPIDPETGLTGSVAYCAQTPWLVGASIRENIVFGSTWDAARYAAVVHACALRRDFEIFDLGDATEVGEKGTTCSGGQKARIALARALYSSARTLVLDDVLSAVDAQTAAHIHRHVLLGPLMRSRTAILVTHALGLVVPSASYVVMLDAGHVVAAGSPAELVAAGTLELETTTPAESDDGKDSKMTQLRSSTSTATAVNDNVEALIDGPDHDALVAKKAQDALESGFDLPDADVGSKADKQLVQKESSKAGAVGADTYMLYFKSMGGIPFWILVSAGFLGTQALQVLTNAWIKEWTEAVRSSLRSLGYWAGDEHGMGFYLAVYLGIAVLYLCGIGFRLVMMFSGSLHASRTLYTRLLKRILGAKMRFFDSTPSGRIMNRLSKDMSSIDQETAEIIGHFFNCVIACVAILAVVVFTTPLFLVALVVITVLYVLVGTLYVATNREIKRIDSVTRSPVFVSFAEALVGMSTIRSYGDSARFLTKLVGELDTNTRCFWYMWQANRVLNNLSNIVGTLVTVSAAVLALTATNMTPGEAGLSITYALSFTEFVLWIVRMYTAAEMMMNSVERVGEYLDLEEEEDAATRAKAVEPPAYWPSRDGSVVVEDLTAKYAPQLEPVLRGVSFTIGPREKIGVCGRTGSGKSTLALSFFRFLYQEYGRIVIDGIDISTLSLATLRARLTILPQGKCKAYCKYCVDVSQRHSSSPARSATTWTPSARTRTSKSGTRCGSVASRGARRRARPWRPAVQLRAPTRLRT
jgi:ABC-type multidrug transport system fused ATPase/permease subunit